MIEINKIRTFRRELHQIPEAELELPKTQRYIIKALRDLPCTITSPTTSSVVAFFDAGKNSSIAFRSDMDALPVTEVNECEYKSKHQGKMHACGHDGHMAMLLGFAYDVSTYYKDLPHNIVLIFQPGEETPGGAEPLCNSGILQKYHVKRIFGFHLWPMLPAGTIATRKNEFMAHASEVNIDIEGKSAHAAKYKEGIDALETAARYLIDIYTMEQNEIAPAIYRLLRFGKIESGTVRNVIANHARLEGSLRSFQEDTHQYMIRRLHEIAKEYEDSVGVKFHFDINKGYPAVINDEKLCDYVLEQLDDTSIVMLETPEMIAEDFAYYQKIVPGMFFFLGTGTGIALHANTFDFQEEVLLKGVETYCKLSKMK